MNVLFQITYPLAFKIDFSILLGRRFGTPVLQRLQLTAVPCSAASVLLTLGLVMASIQCSNQWE